MAKRKFSHDDRRGYFTTVTMPNGKRKFISRHDKKELEQAVEKLEREIYFGTNVDPNDLTIKDLGERMLASKDASENVIRPNTKRYYAYLFEKIVARLGSHKILEIQPEDIEAMLKDMRLGEPGPDVKCVEIKGVSYSVVPPAKHTKRFTHPDYPGLLLKKNKPVANRLRREIFKFLSAMFEFAVTKDLMGRNPCKKVTAPKKIEERKNYLGSVWNQEETQKFLAAARTERLYAVFVLACLTGMRQGEILGLVTDDVDLTTGRLRVQHTLLEVKNGEILEDYSCPCCGVKDGRGKVKTDAGQRDLVLPPEAVAALKQHRAKLLEEGLSGSKWMFPSEEGTPMLKANVRRAMKRICKRAGVKKIRFHDIRHTNGTLMLTLHVDARMAQRALGHSDGEMTSKYTATVEAHQKEVADAMTGVFSI